MSGTGSFILLLRFFPVARRVGGYFWSSVFNMDHCDMLPRLTFCRAALTEEYWNHHLPSSPGGPGSGGQGHGEAGSARGFVLPDLEVVVAWTGSVVRF